MIVVPCAGRPARADGYKEQRIRLFRSHVTEQSEPQAEPTEVPRAPRPRSPLIIGAIAYGLLFWMMLVVCLLIAWKLSLR